MSASASMKIEPNDPGFATSILIADDHWVVRESLKSVARGLCDGEIEEASNLDEALAALARNPMIGLVLIDLVMPDTREFEGLQELRSRFPSVPVVIVSVHEDPEHVLEAIRHGVVGYIPKSCGAAQIKQALSRVLAGEVSFPRDILTRAHATPARDSAAAPPASTSLAPETRSGVDPFRNLTRRETEILAALGRGEALHDIADALDISRQTVRVHLGNAMKKLGTPTRESVIRLAVEHAAALQGIVENR